MRKDHADCYAASNGERGCPFCGGGNNLTKSILTDDMENLAVEAHRFLVKCCQCKEAWWVTGHVTAQTEWSYVVTVLGVKGA